MFYKIVTFFAAWAAVFSCSGAEHAPKIICFGDSLTSCGGKNGRYSDMLQQSLPEYKVINSGKGGDTIGGALARLDEAVLRHRGDFLIIGIGANDYWRRKRSLSDLKKDYEEILKRCHAAGMKIVIISCFGNATVPSGTVIDVNKPGIPHEHYAAGIGAFEKELARKYQAEYVPDMQINITPKGRKELWSDSNHPNASGNRIVADTILPSLRRVLGRKN
jgi:acyl-CoA hydrolase